MADVTPTDESSPPKKPDHKCTCKDWPMIAPWNHDGAVSIQDSAILNQLRKAQGETNERLDRLIAAQERTNQLIEWLGGLVHASQAPVDTT